MEKFIIFLIIAVLILYILFTLPILGKTPNTVYVVLPEKSKYISSSPWVCDNFFVYKVDSIADAKQIPHGKVICEYSSKNKNTIYKGNIFMQTYISGEMRIYGTPYIID